MGVWDDFKAKYVQPRVENVIVGFSGLDPDEYALSLTAEQEKAIRDLILLYLSKLTIRIDSGSLDPNEPPPEVQPVSLKPAEIPHELLDELLGGSEAGHYHVSDDELEKLRKLIAVLFPDGATEPKIPSVPAGTEDPSEPIETEDILGGLPKGTPPTWTQVSFPSGYTASNGQYKLYFGEVPITKTSTRGKELLAVMSSTRSSATRYLMRSQSKNFDDWQRVVTLKTGAGSSGLDNVGTRIRNYLTLSGNGRPQLYVLFDSTAKALQYLYTNSSSSDYSLSQNTISNNSGSTGGYVAGCYSSKLSMAIFLTATGGVTCVKDNKGLTTKEYKNLSCGIAPNAVDWNPDAQVFCAVGREKAAVSSDGKTWRQQANTLNLVEMSYREDLGCLLARNSEGVNYYKSGFYVSGDGLNWKSLDATIPCDTGITTTATEVAYSPELGWYCLIGGRCGTNASGGATIGRYAYFSKDLKHWLSTTVTNGAEISFGSVVWCGDSIKKFVILPTQGDKFYTFDPTQWKD